MKYQHWPILTQLTQRNKISEVFSAEFLACPGASIENWDVETWALNDDDIRLPIPGWNIRYFTGYKLDKTYCNVSTDCFDS